MAVIDENGGVQFTQREEDRLLLKAANETVETVDIKGKQYVPVSERIKAFRRIYPRGCIKTEIIGGNERLTGGVCTMKAEVYDDEGRLLATGHAQEKEGSSFINKTSYIENCETSCIGRALGSLGIGLDEGIASYEEIANAKLQQEEKKKPLATPEQIDLIVENKELILEELKKRNINSTAKVMKLTIEEASELCRLIEERNG